MIQDIFPHVLDNQYRTEQKIAKQDVVFVMHESKFLVHKQLEPANLDKCKKAQEKSNATKSTEPKGIQGESEYSMFLTYKDLLGLDETLQKKKYQYLFSIDETAYFLLREELVLPDTCYMDIRELREQQLGDKKDVFAAMTAKHLDDWYRDNTYCGRCGRKMRHHETERAMKCKKCGYTSYPRIMPAVIVGVIDQNRLLLTKYRSGYRHNALVAGFTEIGETVEETVQREVLEEVGLKVKNIRYYKSQPWGVANDILLGFYCEVDGDTTIRMDENELKYAEFVERQDIELQPDEFSLTNEMMMQFKEGKIRV